MTSDFVNSAMSLHGRRIIDRLLWPSLLAIFVVAVCYPHIFFDVVALGNSDRLNTSLNIRFFEIQSVHDFGRVPLWNDRMFMGFNMTAFHYMIPIIHPISWLLGFFYPDNLLFWMGLWTIVSYYLIGLSAYVLCRDLSDDGFIGLIGAIVYITGYQIYFRAFQVEDAAINYMALPLSIFVVRRLVERTSWQYYVALIVCIVLMMLSFLQETSYAFLFLGLYILYVAFDRRSWRILFVTGAAIAAAITMTAPRVIGIVLDLRNYARASNLHFTDTSEALRLFYDGIFGVNYEQAARYTHVHVHEGYAVYTSAITPLIFLFLSPLCASRKEQLPIAAFYLFLFTSVEKYQEIPLWAYLCLFFLVAYLFSFLPRNQHQAIVVGAAKDDFVFFSWMILIATGIILLAPLRAIFFLFYLRMDFTHSRLSFLVITGVGCGGCHHLRALPKNILNQRRRPRAVSAKLRHRKPAGGDGAPRCSTARRADHTMACAHSAWLRSGDVQRSPRDSDLAGYILRRSNGSAVHRLHDPIIRSSDPT